MEDLEEDYNEQENYFVEEDDIINQNQQTTQQEEEKEVDYNQMQQSGQPTYYMPGLEPLQNEISVCDPTVKDGLTKYYIYSVKGTDTNGAFDVLRRYRDFAALRRALINKWPGCYIPPIPPKKAVGNMEREFVYERTKQLNKFCQEIVKCPHLYNSNEFQTFLRPQVSDVEKALNALPRESTEDIIKKYHAAFYSLSGKTINTELTQKITTFYNTIKKLQGLLKNLEKQMRDVCKSKRIYYQQFQLLFTHILPDYEKQCLTEFSNNDSKKCVFNIENIEFKQTLQNIETNSKKESLEYLADLVIYQVLEIEAFIEAFKAKEKIKMGKSKAMSKKTKEHVNLISVQQGKKVGGFLSIFKKKKPIQQEVKIQEGKIASIDKKLDDLQALDDVISLIQGYYEIDKFKDLKTQSYYNTLRKFIKVENENIGEMNKLWDTIQFNNNLMVVDLNA